MNFIIASTPFSTASVNINELPPLASKPAPTIFKAETICFSFSKVAENIVSSTLG
ncbi:hypothetical protein HYY69_01115 [Candidatus Woesearchaeota archaeon]|nr:hypothetical protein [Candidatus Woesearchaeota archaeon]